MLTPEQSQAMKAAIEASTDPQIVAYLAVRNDSELTNYINATEATPTFVVWKGNVSSDDFRAAVVNGGGVTQLDALTASKRDSLFWYIGATAKPNANVSAALDDFCGSQNTLKASLQAAIRRNATVFERIYATGTGSTVSPGTLVVEGPVSLQEVSTALNS